VLSNLDQPDDLLDDEVVQNHLQSRKSAMTVITDFDPDAFLVVPARTFEDLRIGEVFRAPSRTLTDAHAAAFQTVSMDNHPVHYDDEWARTHGHVAPVVHGLQVLAFTAPGATLFPHFIGEVFISFLELSCTFPDRGALGGHLVPGAHDHRPGAEWRRRHRGHSGHRPQPARATRAVGPAQVPAAASAGRTQRRWLSTSRREISRRSGHHANAIDFGGAPNQLRYYMIGLAQ
jgi:hypothetical protein